MKDESIKIPVTYAFLLVTFSLILLASTPTKQFLEGSFATSTFSLIEPPQEILVATTTPASEDARIASTTSEIVEFSEMATTTINSFPVSTSSSTIEEEIIVDSESPAKVISADFLSDESSVIQIKKEITKASFFEFDVRKCQTSKLNKKYKNPGECIRAMRE